LTGDIETRVQMVAKILNSTSNYTNPLDWRPIA
jgi:hypothetical protein